MIFSRVKDPNPGRVLIPDTFLLQVRVDEEIIAGFQKHLEQKERGPNNYEKLMVAQIWIGAFPESGWNAPTIAIAASW